MDKYLKRELRKTQYTTFTSNRTKYTKGGESTETKRRPL